MLKPGLLLLPLFMIVSSLTAQEIHPAQVLIFEKGDPGKKKVMLSESSTDPLSGDSGFINLPACNHHIIRRFHLSEEQYVFERYLSGTVKKSRFLQIISERQIDTNRLSRSPVRNNAFDAFVGLDKRGQKIVIVDVNQDRDFGNDSIWLFDTSYFGKPNRDCPPLPELSLPGPHGPVIVKLSPYQAYYVRDSYDTRIDMLLELNIAVDTYWTAELKAGGKNQRVYIWDHGFNILKDPRSKFLMLRLEEDSINKYAYRRGEKIKTGNAVLEWYDTTVISPRQNPAIAFRQVGSTVNFEADKGSYVPDFSREGLLTGNEIAISSLKGKYVILDFWGTWCKPCVAMIPEMLAEHQQFKNKPVVFMSIALDRTADEEKLRKVIKAQKMTWMHLWQKWETKSEDNSLTKMFKVVVFPTTILISPTGEILYRGTAAEGFQESIKILKSRL